MLDINKQAMKYALQGQTVTVYEKDEDGNLKFYETEDEEKIYYTHEETGFSEPVDFRANISFDGGEAQNKEYGFNAADFDAVLLTDKGMYPFKKGDVIWLDSEPTKDANGLVDSTSADFTIVGVKPSLYSVKYMLKAIVKGV